MKANPDFSVLCESFFAKRLMAQRKAVAIFCMLQG